VNPVTLWYRKDPTPPNEKPKNFEFNHLADGHLTGTPVTVSDTQQAAWKNAAWKAVHKHLTAEYKVVD